MSEFKPITTQEELDSYLGDRLARKERTMAEKYKDYISPDEFGKVKTDYETQIATLNQTINENAEKYAGFDKKIEDYELKIANYETDSVKTRIAIEEGIPFELKDRLKGTTEEEIREDAKLLSGFASSKVVAPLASSDVSMSSEDIKKAQLELGYKKMIEKL